MARRATKTKAGPVEAEATTAGKPGRRAASAKAKAEPAAAAPRRGRPPKGEAASEAAPRAAKPGRGKSTTRAAAAKASAAAAPAAAGVAALTAPVARGSAKAREALKAAKDQALGLVPPAPSLPAPSFPAPVGETVKAIGSQIVGALSSDVGRVMVAELLVYVAKSLTSAAAKTEAAADAKSAILTAGARLGAVAADAGAKLVETGQAAASGGAKLVEDGKDAAEAGLGAASNASDIMREVAQVAVGAMGGVVADTATKLLKRRGKPNGNAADGRAAEMAKSPGPGNVL